MAEVEGAARPDSGRPLSAGAGVVVRVLPWEGFGMGRVVADPGRLLTGPEVAELLGIQPGTWRSYVVKGLAPAPVDPDEGRPASRRCPRWSLAQVREYRQDPRRNPNMRRGVA